MNKLLKGSIAGAAGIALLLGGAGTLAMWNSAADFGTAATVTSGALKITPDTTTGSWGTGIALWVPGDTDTYSEDFTIVASGDNINATLTATTGAQTAAGFTVTPDYVVTNTATSVPVVAVSGIYTLDEGTYTVEATVDVEFDASGTDNQGASVALNDEVDIILTQVP